MTNETDEQSKKINVLKQEITELRTRLNQVNEEKETWFAKKETARSEIARLIGEIRELKRERDNLTNFVKESKKTREQLNSGIRDKITNIKAAKQERDSLKSSIKIFRRPEEIERNINALEFKIETQVVSFDEEQKLMKVIKQMKAELIAAKKSSGAYEKVGSLSREIDKEKVDADSLHAKIQESAAESQKKHELLIELSKKVDALRVEEEEAYKKFMELKNQFTEINGELKNRLVAIGESKDEMDELRVQSRKDRKQRENRLIEEKERQVSEKIKTGKKLTTDDLLVFQKAEMEKETATKEE